MPVPPTHCFWEKKTRKKKINPPSRLYSAKSHYACTGIVALFDIIVSVDRSRLRDRDDDILPKGSSMMTLIQI